ncbi:MAG: hypothetical protein OER86_02895 [Phycisphaerae bacterium]|nr:hypothetical protein [Phycisphaerae bacterium]
MPETKLTKERKIYAGLLIVAVVGLGADQLFLQSGATGPGPATAAPISSAALVPTAGTRPVPAAVPAVDLSAITREDEGALSFRLVALADDRGFRLPAVEDAFRPDASWEALIGSEPLVPEKPVVEPRALKVQRFVESHRLMAVMRGARGGLAIIDGQPLRVGEELDGFVLRSVKADSASFRKGEEEAVLMLQLPGTDKPSSQSPKATDRDERKGPDK